MKYTIGFKELPFGIDVQQVIYVENQYDAVVNDFIVRNYEAIFDHFASRGYEFVYLPLHYSRFSEQVRSYYNPMCDNSKNIPIKSSLLLDYMARPENREKIPPSFLYTKRSTQAFAEKEVILGGISIDNTYPIFEDIVYIERAINRDQNDIPRFMIVSDAPEDNLDSETEKLLQEIEERVNKLKQNGISHYILENLLRAPITPSRMVITSDYRIFLPDYNNMEIEMTPLVKAVYILFLRHPEGILFKHLTDYSTELEQIYTDMRGGILTDQMRQSVMLATSPLNNSINEKCARIREAFISKFEESLAEPYIVRGQRGCPKSISISRQMVEWIEK